MLRQLETESNKFWTIIGAGPVGAMQAVLLATLFPNKQIQLLDRYHKSVRGHGLLIWNKTTNKIIRQLNSIKKQIKSELKKDKAHPRTEEFQKILANIDKTSAFLTDNFKKVILGEFIRTNILCEKLIAHAKTLAEQNLTVNLDAEITADDLNHLRDNFISDESASANSKLLKQSDIIFAADGGHSRFRSVMFNEGFEQLDKRVHTHVVEIKVEMKHQNSFLKNLVKRSLKPILKNGSIYTWYQSKDNVSSLHTFVNEKTYKLLKSKSEVDPITHAQKPLGEFANPYRRIATLPTELRKPFYNIISTIIGSNAFHQHSLKITAIPMQTYKAKELTKKLHGKDLLLAGDAAVGLIIVRGVNNGLETAAEYATALFNNKDFKASEKIIKDIADKKIKSIKTQTRLINFLNNTLGKILSPFSQANLPLVKNPQTKNLLKELKTAIPKPNYEHDKQNFEMLAAWLFYIDVLYISLKDEINTLENKKSLEKLTILQEFIQSTTLYVQTILSEATFTEKMQANNNYLIKVKPANPVMQGILKEGLQLIYQKTIAAPDIDANFENSPFATMRDLQLTIDTFNIKTIESPEKIKLITSLQELHQDLLNDINRQILKKRDTQSILKSGAIKIANETMIMLEKFSQTPNDIQIIKNYKTNCLRVYGWKSFSKALAHVFVAGIKFIFHRNRRPNPADVVTLQDYSLFRKNKLEKDTQKIAKTFSLRCRV